MNEQQHAADLQLVRTIASHLPGGTDAWAEASIGYAVILERCEDGLAIKFDFEDMSWSEADARCTVGPYTPRQNGRMLTLRQFGVLEQGQDIPSATFKRVRDPRLTARHLFRTVIQPYEPMYRKVLDTLEAAKVVTKETKGGYIWLTRPTEGEGRI